ncbi:hypothetical protein LTR27_001587 [Elasticomyces elasticus]|nr:hypothetical protein LTR27_001587 [Elasticomyces elasticus]
MFPGGFGKSKLLTDRIALKWPNLRILEFSTYAGRSGQPVSLGSLYRFYRVTTRGIGPTESYGIAQVDVFDPQRHPDACLLNANGLPSDRPDMKIVQRSPINNALVVWDRYVKIMFQVREQRSVVLHKGNLLTRKPQDTQAEPLRPVWQQLSAYPAQKVLKQQMYWTDADRQNADRILEEGKTVTAKNAKLHRDFERYGQPMEWPLPDLKEYELIPTWAGPRYILYYCLTMGINGANADCECRFAEPGFEPWVGEHEDQFDPDDLPLKDPESRRIWSADYNPVPRTNPN